ncbi:magnetosome protein MamQ [Magnetospira sp. QH-2]|uniref:magnetosome protein MamQ n=1 Tax=Magnetospira sp. (strain QH-2) TaxID=1288970 RepID=UPI0003E815BA|nr:magnetosome protein MamQ [Magnetospira sp. QH-2]CCQ72999.1 Magnetosome protein MamQ [Magnetospira sp. QH-2]
MAKYSFKPEGVGNGPNQQARVSENILAQLYHKELDPPFRAPPVRGVRFAAIFSVVALVLFSATLFYKFNNFILLREDVYTKGGNLQAALQRRSNLFGNLVKLTLNHAALEHSIFFNASDSRADIIKESKLPDAIAEQLLKGIPSLPDGGLGGDWDKVLQSLNGDGSVESSLGRLLAVVEQYPDVKSAETYKEAMRSLVEIEDRIATRRMEFHMSLREYNVNVSKFPWYLLAKMTDFKRIDYFTTTEGASAPSITPDIFEDLLQMDHKDKK